MAGERTITVRRATTADVNGIAGAYARAFNDDDPLFNWLVPDAAKRARAMDRWFELAVRKLYFKKGIVYTTDDHAGASVWMEPGKWEIPFRDILPILPGTGRIFGLRTARRFLAVLDACDKKHPHEPHWYLAGLGTDPPHQRKGVGTALMRPVLDRCDAEGMPAYLETQKARNVPYYRAHGFEVREEIVAPLGGPRLWLMWRDPR